MDELRLKSRTEELAEKIGHIGWGYIFIYLNINLSINLNTIDILPSWAGYLFILSALPVIAEYAPSAGLLRNLAKLLAAWAVAEWVMNILGLTSDTGGMTPVFDIINIIIGVITIYFHFQMLTDLAETAGLLGHEEHNKKLLQLRTINTVLHTVIMVVSSLAFLESVMWLVLGLAVVNFINTIRITISLFSLKRAIQQS